jgi:hypothetical protein
MNEKPEGKQIIEYIRSISQDLCDLSKNVEAINTILDRVQTREVIDKKGSPEARPEPQTITQTLEFLREDSRAISLKIEYLGERCEKLF